MTMKLQFSDKLLESMERTLLKDLNDLCFPRTQKVMHRDEIIGYILAGDLGN